MEGAAKQDKKTPKRPTLFGFYITNLPDGVSGTSDPITFLNVSLTQTEGIMASYKVKEIHFINLGATSAVRIRTGDQHYIKKWKELINGLFVEANRIAGESVVCELNEETSDQVKTLFRERERKNDSSVHPFRVSNHPIFHCFKLCFLQ